MVEFAKWAGQGYQPSLARCPGGSKYHDGHFLSLCDLVLVFIQERMLDPGAVAVNRRVSPDPNGSYSLVGERNRVTGINGTPPSGMLSAIKRNKTGSADTAVPQKLVQGRLLSRSSCSETGIK